MVYVLAIDNSTKYLSVAYGECTSKGIKNYNYYHEIHINNASNNILPKINEILNKYDKNIPDYIALGIGPGAFTGVRLASSIAMGLSLAWDIKIVPICSLLCAVESYRSGHIKHIKTKPDIDFSEQNNRIILDARMNEIYTRTFSYANNKYSLGNIELLNINYEFISVEQNSTSKNNIILTDIENYKYEHDFTTPHALGLLSLMYNNLDFACFPHQIQPNYIRNKVQVLLQKE